MKNHAYLMVLLGVTNTGGIIVLNVAITSNQHLTCKLQTQVYACLEETTGESYHQAKQNLINSIEHRMNISQSGSLWHSIYALIASRETQ